MTRAVANKLYNNFCKGLITEATELTYPENATVDEENCVLYVAGNRKRRLGFDYEPDAVLSTFSNTAAEVNNNSIFTYPWLSVNNDSDVNFVVVQHGLKLHFYDYDNDAISSSEQTFSVDLSSFAVSGAAHPEYEILQITSLKGYLFVASKYTEPCYIVYDPNAHTMTASRIYVQIRDFKGVNDGLANDQEPGTLTNLHKYNLMNQGWVSPTNTGTSSIVPTVVWDAFGGNIGGGSYVAPGTDPIDTYHTKLGRYPSNAQQWWIGKSATADPDAVPPYDIGDFLPTLLAKTYFGNAHAPQGHYVLNAFNRDRTAISGISGLTAETFADRPQGIASYSGRVWFGHNNSVYYSQLLSDISKAGFCYQEADPTAEDISDLIDTDGGIIEIPEMFGCNRLLPLSNGLLVFAENGVWYIAGTANSGFTATSFEITKVDSIGTDCPNTAVVIEEDKVFWWSNTGIMGMSPRMGNFGSIQGKFDQNNLSLVSIQTFFDHIPKSSKKTATAVYDRDNKLIQWLYKDAPQINFTQQFFYNRVINYDVLLQAFYPWTINPTGDGFHPYVCGCFYKREELLEDRQTGIRYLVAIPTDAGKTLYHYTIGMIRDNTFRDWPTFSEANSLIDNPYNSYLVCGYELLQDAMRRKQAPYVLVYLKKTEQNYVLTGDGDYTVDFPSSCKMQVRWDWADSATSNQFNNPVETYKWRRRQVEPDEGNLAFDNGYAIVVSKHKVRGSGRAIQFRFSTSEVGHDFNLLGWSVEFTGNTVP